MAAEAPLDMAASSSFSQATAGRPDIIEQDHIQAAVAETWKDEHGTEGRPDVVEDEQILAAVDESMVDELSSSTVAAAAWAYRSKADDGESDEEPIDTRGPAPQEWIKRGWIDYSADRRAPAPGEAPWYGWCNYTEEEWQRWSEQQVEKAVRLAERDEEEGTPTTRSPLPKKVKAPTDPVSIDPSSMLVDLFESLRMP